MDMFEQMPLSVSGLGQVPNAPTRAPAPSAVSQSILMHSTRTAELSDQIWDNIKNTKGATLVIHMFQLKSQCQQPGHSKLHGWFRWVLKMKTAKGRAPGAVP